MLRVLPVQNPGELVILNWSLKSTNGSSVVWDHSGSSYLNSGGSITSPDFPWPAYEQLHDRNSVFF
jgi:hypothetical protein